MLSCAVCHHVASVSLGFQAKLGQCAGPQNPTPFKRSGGIGNLKMKDMRSTRSMVRIIWEQQLFVLRKMWLDRDVEIRCKIDNTDG